MADLAHELAAWRGRRVCILGVGSVDRGDDAFGVRLAQGLAPALGGGPARAVDAGTWPERYVGLAAEEGAEAVVFADAVRFGGAPGALLFAATTELLARPPTTATHRVPISVLARYAEGLGMRAFLLGVEPGTLEGTALSPAVAGTLRAATELLAGVLGASGREPVRPELPAERASAGHEQRPGHGSSRVVP
jgi:hydrogenase maturation protease